MKYAVKAHTYSHDAAMRLDSCLQENGIPSRLPGTAVLIYESDKPIEQLVQDCLVMRWEYPEINILRLEIIRVEDFSVACHITCEDYKMAVEFRDTRGYVARFAR